MHIAPRPALLLILMLASACQRGPSDEEALRAIRTAQPQRDSAVVYGRVWQDGPPWFSCAEVLAKAESPVDSQVVRDQVGNWKPLVVAGLVVLRDTASGPLADPGWCTVKATPLGQTMIARWLPARGPIFPTGRPRRGWTMLAGHLRLEVDGSPALTGKDSASATYRVVVATNANGTAIGAGRDTARFIADLRRIQGTWRMTASRPAPTPEQEP